MNDKIRDFERQSGLEIYGLGAKRDKWEIAMSKFAKLVADECASVVENQGKFMKYDSLASKIKEKFEIKND